MKYLRITAVFYMIFMLLILPAPAHAWWAIMHYVIARDEIGIPQPEYANMPDVWPNRDWKFGITNDFFWTHGMVDHGRNAWAIPNAPTYPFDGRYPEMAMAEMIKKTSRSITNADRNMVIGYAVHNAMDRNVHYDYFHGGDTKDNWAIQHLIKEEWSDYYAYGVLVCGSDVHPDIQGLDQFDNLRGVFNVSGFPTTVVNLTIPVDGAWLLRKAQLSMQKSGYDITAGGGNKFTVLNSADSEVQNKITQFNGKDYDDGLARATDPANAKCIRESRWNELREMAHDPSNNWTIDGLKNRITKSIDCAKAWKATVQGTMQ